MKMVSKTSLAALLCLSTAVAGCSTAATQNGVAVNRGLDSVHQPVVQRTDYVMDVDMPDGSRGAASEARLHAWFKALGIGYGDRVYVDEAYPSGARQTVARVAADYGLLLSEGAPVTAGQVQPGSVRVIVSRSVASVPSCPNWSGPSGPSSTSSNYGCSMNSNIAAMVADPADLVLGQAGSSAVNAATASKAIKVYREAPPTGAKGLEQLSTTKGGK